MNSSPVASPTCPECGRPNLHQARVAAAGIHGPSFLPGLGGFLDFAKFRVVVCADCGLTRFYAEPSAREKLTASRHWSRL